MSLTDNNANAPTLSGVGNEGTLVLPSTVNAVSIGGDFGSAGQVIAKNESTNKLEWDYVDDLSIPDHSIAGVKLKTDITFDTTGDIGCAKLDCPILEADTTIEGTCLVEGNLTVANPDIMFSVFPAGNSKRANLYSAPLEISNISPHASRPYALLCNGELRIDGGGGGGTTGKLAFITATDTIRGYTSGTGTACFNLDLGDSSNSIPDNSVAQDLTFYRKLHGTDGLAGSETFLVDGTNGDVDMTGDLTMLNGVAGAQTFGVVASSGDTTIGGMTTTTGELQFHDHIESYDTSAEIKGYGAGNETECSYLDLRSATNLMPLLTGGSIHNYDPTTPQEIEINEYSGVSGWVDLVGGNNYTDITFSSKGLVALYQITIWIDLTHATDELVFRYVNAGDSSVIDLTTRQVYKGFANQGNNMISFNGYFATSLDTDYTLRPQFKLSGDSAGTATFYFGGDIVADTLNYPPFIQHIYTAPADYTSITTNP